MELECNSFFLVFNWLSWLKSTWHKIMPICQSTKLEWKMNANWMGKLNKKIFQVSTPARYLTFWFFFHLDFFLRLCSNEFLADMSSDSFWSSLIHSHTVLVSWVDYEMSVKMTSILNEQIDTLNGLSYAAYTHDVLLFMCIRIFLWQSVWFYV